MTDISAIGPKELIKGAGKPVPRKLIYNSSEDENLYVYRELTSATTARIMEAMLQTLQPIDHATLSIEFYIFPLELDKEPVCVCVCTCAQVCVCVCVRVHVHVCVFVWVWVWIWVWL